MKNEYNGEHKRIKKKKIEITISIEYLSFFISISLFNLISQLKYLFINISSINYIFLLIEINRNRKIYIYNIE